MSNNNLIIEEFNLLLHNGKKLKFDQIKLSSNDRVWIKGPTGSGKSTFMKSLFSIIPFECRSIKNDNTTITAYDLRKLSYYIPQSPSYDDITLKDTVSLIEKFSSGTFLNDKFLHLFKKYFPTTFLKKEFSKLSGGQQQYFSLCLGLSSTKKFLFLDECFGAMDPELLSMSESLLMKDQNQKVYFFIHHFHNDSFLKPTQIIEV